MDLTFIRRNLRSFLGIPENIVPGTSPSLPTASLPTASLGHPPEILLTRPAPVASVAPVAAAAPRFRKASVDGEGFTAYQRKIQYEARLKTEFGLNEKLEVAGMKSEARRKVLSDFDRFIAARPLAKAAPAPALADDNQTPRDTPPPDDPENPAGIESIISQLLDLLKELQKLVATTPADDEEATAALGLFTAGKKLSASRAFMALTEKMCKRPKLSPQARIARGFSAQAGVQAIQNCLRPGPRTAPAARTAPAMPHVAPVASTSPAGSRDRARAIQAELKSIDAEFRKTGFYSPAAQARFASLTRERQALSKLSRPQ